MVSTQDQSAPNPDISSIFTQIYENAAQGLDDKSLRYGHGITTMTTLSGDETERLVELAGEVLISSSTQQATFTLLWDGSKGYFVISAP